MIEIHWVVLLVAMMCSGFVGLFVIAVFSAGPRADLEQRAALLSSQLKRANKTIQDILAQPCPLHKFTIGDKVYVKIHKLKGRVKAVNLYDDSKPLYFIRGTNGQGTYQEHKIEKRDD